MSFRSEPLSESLEKVFDPEIKESGEYLASKEWAVVKRDDFIFPEALMCTRITVFDRHITVRTDSQLLIDHLTLIESEKTVHELEHLDEKDDAEIIYMTKSQPHVRLCDGTLHPLQQQHFHKRAEVAFDPIKRSLMIYGIEKYGSLDGVIKGISTFDLDLDEKLPILPVHAAIFEKNNKAVMLLGSHTSKGKTYSSVIAQTMGFRLLTDDWGGVICGAEKNYVIGIEENINSTKTGGKFIDKSYIRVIKTLEGIIFFDKDYNPDMKMNTLKLISLSNPHTPFHSSARWNDPKLNPYKEGTEFIKRIVSRRAKFWEEIITNLGPSHVDNIIPYDTDAFIDSLENIL
ncbi:MAG: hypothetical protein ACD_61C00007G0011 [uncultured bacterium]|nr:MAG: hypothetical protein ACD_61C00007G0011 [uncultured bacterium]